MTQTGPGFPSMIASAASMCAGDRSPSPTPACLWHRSSSLPVANSCVFLGLSGCRASRACRHPGRGCSRQRLSSKRSLRASAASRWVHENAMSADRYLPETMGPGVAFIDYDNDGWIDIFMVNSGPSDFYKPAKPLKNALYKNNRNGTFTDVTDKAGVAGGKEFGMGCAVARLRQRRLSRHPRHRLWPVHALP